MPSSQVSVEAQKDAMASPSQPVSDWSTSLHDPSPTLSSERIKQLERSVQHVSKMLEELTTSTRDSVRSVHHVNKALEELTTSTRDNISQIRNEVSLLQKEAHFSKGFGGGASSGAQTPQNSQSTSTNEIFQRLQDVEDKIEDHTSESSTLAASVKDMQKAIIGQCNGVFKGVARSIEGYEKSWSQHMRQQLELHRDEQVSRVDFLQQLQEEASASARTDLARVDAALRDLAAEHDGQHKTLADRVEQLEGGLLASDDCNIACRMLTDIQGELTQLAKQVLVLQRTHAMESDRATEMRNANMEGVQGVSDEVADLQASFASVSSDVTAKVADLQASFASVSSDVSTLAQDLVEMRSEHLVAVTEVGLRAERCAQQTAQQGLAASVEAEETENRFQELTTKIHAVQVSTAGEMLELTRDLAAMRFNLGGVTEAVAEAQAAAASIQHTEARFAKELNSKCDELTKFVCVQQEELCLKAKSLMGTVLAERVSQQREGQEPSKVSVTGSATVSEPQAPVDSLTEGRLSEADSKAVISMIKLRHSTQALVDTFQTMAGDHQPRVLKLEREGGICDSSKKTFQTLSRALPCATRNGSCPPPALVASSATSTPHKPCNAASKASPRLALSATSAQHSPRDAASKASPRGCLQATWPPPADQVNSSLPVGQRPCLLRHGGSALLPLRRVEATIN